MTRAHEEPLCCMQLRLCMRLQLMLVKPSSKVI